MATLYQVTAPHFTAGLEAKADLVVHAAPIIKYMTGWPLIRVGSYCATKRRTMARLAAEPPTTKAKP